MDERYAISRYEQAALLLPAKWQRSLARYASGAGPESRHNTWLRLLRRMMLPGALYLVFCIFAEAAFLRYAAPWIEARIPGRTLR